MNNTQQGVVLIGVAFFVAFAIGACKPEAASVPHEYEFVCYTQDKLTERHVGVEPLGTYCPNVGDVCQVAYVDGPGKRYRQRPGESCGVEQVL